MRNKYTPSGPESPVKQGTQCEALGLSYSHISSPHPVLAASYVEYAPLGSYIKLRFKNLTTEKQREAAAKFRGKQGQYLPGVLPGMRATENGGSWHAGRQKRGRVSGFTASSQRRLRVLTNSLPSTMPLPLFITLTYPAVWEGDPKVWKRDLDRMLTILHRKLDAPCMIWKMEPQQRGAPHFHLAVYTEHFLKHRWVARTWWRVVGSGERDHLVAGTQVKRARTRRGSLSYMAKYIGKRQASPPGWDYVGRWWGVRNRPKGMLTRVWVAQHSAYRIRRALWSYRASHNRRFKRTPYRGDAQGASAYLPGPLAARLVAYGLDGPPRCGPCAGP